MISHSDLLLVLSYDPITGHFISNVNKNYGRANYKIGQKVGYKDGHGYYKIGFQGKYFRANRLAWFYMTGEWPKNLIDHKNGIKDDNRWENLREATHTQNGQNKKVSSKNTTGVKGVSKGKNGKFRVTLSLGTFDTIEEAKRIYDEAAIKLHGDFFRRN